LSRFFTSLHTAELPKRWTMQARHLSILTTQTNHKGVSQERAPRFKNNPPHGSTPSAWLGNRSRKTLILVGCTAPS
jgi:hypothetical protein